jgi:predicted ATPase/predicted  nucleic acid-binding Zn-ribbon protein
MKLIAFRIKNFRSIQDTQWHTLAFDNITCLIGQNESGKTSVLEGLRSFNDGVLIEDMLRSDLSLPIVTCRFSFDFKELETYLDMKRVHPDLAKKLASLESISLTRKWDQDLTSYIETGEELKEFFDASEKRRKARETKVNKILDAAVNDSGKAKTTLEKIESEINDIEESIEEERQRLGSMKKPGRGMFSKQAKEKRKEEMESLQQSITKLEGDKKKKQGQFDQKKSELNKIGHKLSIKEKLEACNGKIHELKNEIALERENISQLSKITGFTPTEKEMRAAQLKEQQLREEIVQARNTLQEAEREYDLILIAAEHVIEGLDLQGAMHKAEKEIRIQEQHMGSQELAEGLFKHAPEFEMFEDFSSLLPNRIDLEDIIQGNTRAEGYKAAINFLTITGLEYSFFQQPSSRILKQKIENLNGELTLNFQEFWKQNVGKNNKIKISFELAHYDHTHGEKSGKPFVEFWIKDESERLYPKQRSRGVRWFLSFFLELKASAMDKTRHNKVLLIDEPGVSLHARAQEDVLKVFDDIKDRMQIIYSTHSPHLIDVNKLYRVIAVQRAQEDNMNSETLLYNARSLRSATADTLSPVYSMMGARLSQQDIIKAFNNVIVKDLATFYFLKAILHLTDYRQKECFFIPASGVSSMPMIINILIGWGLEYIALNFGNEEERYMHDKLQKELFSNNVDLAQKQLMYMGDFLDAEDMFSTIDFKKHIVHVREGITTHNSEYLKDNNHSRAVLASNFLQTVTQGKVTIKDFDEESRDNLSTFIGQLAELLK